MQLSARERTMLAGAAGVASIIGVGYLIQRELRRWRLLSAHMAQVLRPALSISNKFERRSLLSCIIFAFSRLLSAFPRPPWSALRLCVLQTQKHHQSPDTAEV